ncbi:MAG: DUF1223 domain-containing protein [Betaproteobacteria bacterium]|nr:DUF1223 domain-containing protein [Betaproteobacteria bacterium]
MSLSARWGGLALILLSFNTPGATGGAVCAAQSGPMTTALVELYTSEGCSSCPPADQQLSQFPSSRFPADKAVPIALHVPYWDYIGWKDPYAKSVFAERQSWLVQANRHRTVYTPHYFVSGAEVGDWRNQLPNVIQRINAQPSRADLRLQVNRASGGPLSIDASAASALKNDALALYIAVTESRLVSPVSRGENSGATLHHDHVVREWIGPIALVAGKASAHRDVALQAGWVDTEIGVVGLVQNTTNGEVIQAVAIDRCFKR